MSRIFRYVILAVILSTFTIGWRSSPQSRLIFPISMTLAGERLLVSDRDTGIHIFDVADPQEPEPVVTIPIYGNRGTAVKGDIVYANKFNRLLVIKVEGSSYDILKVIDPSDDYGSGGPWVDAPPSRDYGYGCFCSARSDNVVFAPTESAGGGGSSYASFAIIGNFLYYVDHHAIVTMDVSVPEDPKELSRTHVGWTIETLFPMDNLLYVGGSQGMYMFDRSNPSAPEEIGRIEHFRACDPVVADDTNAFVTLRGEGECGGTRNVLLCVDITDPASPRVIAERQMPTPYGLALNETKLYVSTGMNGFDLLDVSVPGSPQRVARFREWGTKDFIWAGNTLFVLGFEEVRIFDVSVPSEPVFLSSTASE